ncbi:sulfatase-like hydrolase/transferase [Roseimicrobium sp. ORNL1]|uniref:sulfatase-like hydrolase/transferase n=1 Tax=Roseimicrobium sp. ORNL1 TaxID=2711231 RepID=UPI0013E19436|nr:sulfatase-like hydrolase/transferase [Roseimicrobium sp. ORNL1]QIF03849.1 sulfatase-like hydrolase/transferase [Roseimicrobium sp. ORNL1]
MANPDPNRRQFLKQLSAAMVGTQFFGVVTQQTAQGAQLPSPMNLMLILTDQERPPMWIPAGWEAANLPNTTRLKNNGLTFTHAFCATAMCTPSRNSLFTGLFPAQHHAHSTLTEDYQQSPIEPQLDPSLPNLATCLMEAGYDVIYKGKWHMSHGIHGVDGTWIEDDLSRYGFSGWDAPDAGGDTAITNFGGGTANHDQRFISDAKAFLENRIQNPTGRPFCLVVSLINPHDVLAYPGLPLGGTGTPAYIEGGYDDSWLVPTVPPLTLPPTVNENLATNYKPTAHAAIKAVMAGGLGIVATPQVQQNYLNFYGNLMKKVDGQIGELLATFDNLGAAGTDALNDTLIIRTSDHGENGMCHGALRQKTFVTYDEVLRVPLIWSNPVLYPTAQSTNAMVSHVDLLPTLCALTGVPNWQTKNFAGIDYSSIVLNPAAPPVQDYILFTFDDIYAAADAATFPNGAVPPPNRIRMVRSQDYKYARYFDGAGAVADQQEFYDLRPDGGDYNAFFGLPLEVNNISEWAEAQRVTDGGSLQATPEQEAARTTLMGQLATLETTRLAPRSFAPSIAPEQTKFEIKRWTDPTLGEQAEVQITFLSRINTNYQMQKSTDLVLWANVGSVVIGNNGPVLMSDAFQGGKAFYRVQWASAS